MDPFLEPSPASRKEKKLLDHMREVMRVKHYSLRTERWSASFVSTYTHAPNKQVTGVKSPLD